MTLEAANLVAVSQAAQELHELEERFEPQIADARERLRKTLVAARAAGR